MEIYLPISYLNDFVFCPRSIYFHQLYGKVEQRLYQTTDQTEGKAAHRAVDERTYSTSRHILQGAEVYSDKYRIGGKIDTFDIKKGSLVERKKKIKTIYDGYVFQLYAQYHCLTEMGYAVKSMKFYSMDDNKNYSVPLPTEDADWQKKFEQVVLAVRSFNLKNEFTPNIKKCERCIYNNLCDASLC